MELAALCDIYVELKMAPAGAIWLISVLILLLSLSYSPPNPLSTSISVFVVLAMPVRNYQKWWEIQLAIHSTVGV